MWLLRILIVSLDKLSLHAKIKKIYVYFFFYLDSGMIDGVQRPHFRFSHGGRRSRPSISSVCGLLTGINLLIFN